MKELIESINNLLGGEQLFLNCSYGGYKVEQKDKNGLIDLSKRGTKKETLIFLDGMLKILELQKRRSN